MPTTSPVRAPINGAVLAWARNVGGLSREELAQTVGKPGQPDVIARWESGQEEPTIRQLGVISAKLKRPIATFFLAAPPLEPDPAATFKRTVALEAGGFSPELRLAIRSTRYTRDRFVDLLEESGERPVCKLPAVGLDSDPEEVALQVRELVGVSVAQQMKWPIEDAYRRWAEALLKVGVLHQQFEVDPGQAWGFSIPDGLMPVAAVNRKIAAKNGRIFTLWHEVGHIVLREASVSVLEPSDSVSDNKAEQFCNSFAAAFLMPIGSDLVQLATRHFDVDALDEQSVQRAATRFRVSKYVMLRRLVSVGKVKPEVAKSLRREWWAIDVSREKERKERERELQKKADKPPRIPKWRTALWDKGEIVAGRALDALSDGHATPRTVSDLLGIGPQDIEKVAQSLARRGGE